MHWEGEEDNLGTETTAGGRRMNDESRGDDVIELPNRTTSAEWRVCAARGLPCSLCHYLGIWNSGKFITTLRKSCGCTH